MLQEPLCFQDFQFSLVQSLDRLGHWEDMRDNSEEILI